MIIEHGRAVCDEAEVAQRLWPLGPRHVAAADVFGLPTNTGAIAVGGAGVSITDGNETGYVLHANESLTLQGPIDLHDVWIVAAVAGEGVRWGAFVDSETPR